MNAKLSGIVTVGIFFSITIIGFVAWVSALTVLWLFLHVFNLTADLMAMIEALSTAIAAAQGTCARFTSGTMTTRLANTPQSSGRPRSG